ncbi:MAG TPA: translation initiation factor IF-2 N-terminal domain-containing protein [bacterium]|nr:translation initiation factor IF-2 N-terminal domain-containing protein [bacterium]
MRIYQYAKQIGLSPKHLIEICENAGIKGKTYVSGLKDDEISVIDKYIKKSRFTGKSLVCDGTETVGQIASKLGISAGDIIKQLSDIGITAKINDTIGVINIKKLCEVLAFRLKLKKQKQVILEVLLVRLEKNLFLGLLS